MQKRHLNGRGRTGLVIRGTIHRSKVNKADRTIEFSLSSEMPVQRDGYLEVLDHSPDSVDLSRLKNAHPLLLNHNMDDQIGVVEDAWLAGKRLRCRARFGNSDLAEDVFQDVIDGIRKHVSVGYSLVKQLEAFYDKATNQQIIRFAWQPFEASIVGIPADTSVGIGRSGEEAEPLLCPNCALGEMCFIGNGEDGKHVHQCSKCGYETHGDVQADLEDQVEDATGAELEGESQEEFIERVQEIIQGRDMPTNRKIAETKLFGLNEVEAGQFSLVRAIRDIITLGHTTGFEMEMLQEGQRQYDLSGGEKLIGNIFIPPDLMVGVNRRDPLFRDLTTSTGSQGGDFVQTTIMTPIIEILRNKTVMKKAGVQFLGGLQGNIAIPRQSGTATAYSVSEQATIPDSTPEIQQVLMSPRRVGAYASYSKQLFIQSSVDVENFVRADFMKVLAIKMDGLIINGQGGTDPLGILNTTGISSVTFGGAATWGKVIDFETNVATDNADVGANGDIARLSYITTPTVRAKWKQAQKIAASNFPSFLWESSIKFVDADGEVNGHQAFSTNQIPNSLVMYGNFEDDIFGMWGGLDIVVDPFTSARSGTINITINSWVDNAVRHAVSFVASSDSGEQ